MVPETFAFLPQRCRIEPEPNGLSKSVTSSPSQSSSPVVIISCLDNFNSLHTGLTPPVLPLAVQTPHCNQTDSSIRKSLPWYFSVLLLYYFFIIWRMKSKLSMAFKPSVLTAITLTFLRILPLSPMSLTQ